MSVLTEDIEDLLEGFRDEEEDDLDLSDLILDDLTEEDLALVPELVDVIWTFACLFSGIKMFWYQEEFGRRLIESVLSNDGDDITALFSRQSGKALAIDTPILTEDGWKYMKELKRGDRVYAPDGSLTTITATSQVFYRHDCYRVSFSDGQEVVADADHRWTLRDAQTGEPITLTTAELASIDRRWLNKGKSCWRHHVEAPKPIQRPWADLPVDPYVLGLWLGDGSSSKAEITTADPECAEAVLAAGYELGYTAPAGGRSLTYGFRGGLFKALCGLNLIRMTDRHEGFKHIPLAYAMASEKQRMALLQGLMDSDGHCTSHGEVEFSTTKLLVAQDVLFLVRSLGWKATMRKGTATLNGIDCGPKYRVCWTPYAERNPFRLERKASRVKQAPTQTWRRRRTESIALVAVEPVESVPTKCIAVEHPSHLYLAGTGLIPTHNTETVANVVPALMIMLPILAGIPIYEHLLAKFKRGIMVGTFAPIKEQAATLYERIHDRLTSPRAQRFLSDPEINDYVEEKGNKRQLARLRSLVRVMSAHPKAQIESKSYHLIIMDESQHCDDRMWSKSISPMGASTNATKVMLGTPDIHKGVFYRTIRLNVRSATQRGGRKNHFQYDWKVAARCNPNYAKYVAKERKKLGDDSDEFRLAYKLEWILERGMFTTSSRMEELGDRRMRRVKTWAGHTYIGIDPARKVDSTVVTAVWVDWNRPNENGLCHHRVLDWLEMPGEGWEEQYFRMRDFILRYNTQAVGVDEGGMGDNVIDRLNHLLPSDIPVVPLGSSPKEQSRRWKYLSGLIGGTHEYYGTLLAYPAHPDARKTKTWQRFVGQMTDLEKKYQGPYMMAEAPDETGAHDDFADSLALACVLSQDGALPEVEVSDNVLMAR